MPKQYTRAEANALLPELVPLLETVRDSVQTMAAIEAEAAEVRRMVRTNGHGRRAEELTAQAAVTEHALRDALERLHALDIELKDPRIGLIDFYHERDGRLVFLCWKLGEPEILYWHDLDAGFAGRQLLL